MANITISSVWDLPDRTPMGNLIAFISANAVGGIGHLTDGTTIASRAPVVYDKTTGIASVSLPAAGDIATPDFSWRLHISASSVGNAAQVFDFVPPTANTTWDALIATSGVPFTPTLVQQALDAATAAAASATAAANSVKQNYVALARTPDTLITGTVTRDSNGAATSAAVTWPDGSPGTYTADTLSTAFPGAVDGYHITYGSPVTKTYTQPTITRDSTGAATVVPAIVVS